MFSTDALHNFLTGQLIAKLRKEIEDMHVFGHGDLVCHAHHFISRYLGSMPKWFVRCAPRFGLKNPDLVVFREERIHSICQFIFALKADVASFLPAPEIEEEINWLKDVLAQRAPEGTGQGYVIVAFDYEKKWFVPLHPEKQRVFVVPISCREVTMHQTWRPRWDELKKRLF